MAIVVKEITGDILRFDGANDFTVIGDRVEIDFVGSENERISIAVVNGFISAAYLPHPSIDSYYVSTPSKEEPKSKGKSLGYHLMMIAMGITASIAITVWMKGMGL